jgi:hypothetical protein
VSLNKEKVSREIRENKIAVCEKTQGLRSGNFSDFNSACSKVLVPVKIFQFHHMHYESERYWDAANGLKAPQRNSRSPHTEMSHVSNTVFKESKQEMSHAGDAQHTRVTEFVAVFA